MAARRRDSLAFALLVLLLGSLLWLTTLLPNARSAARLEARADLLAADVGSLETTCEELRREVVALENDPWYIERMVRRKLKELRRFSLPSWNAWSAPATAAIPASAASASGRAAPGAGAGDPAHPER